MPDSPISIIDFHGFNDTTIPASPDVEGVLGPGPDNTTQTHDGYYYHIKAHHLARVRAAMNCEEDSAIYPTHMDGEEGWACQAGDIFCTNKSEFVNTLHSGCKVLTPGSGVGRL